MTTAHSRAGHQACRKARNELSARACSSDVCSGLNFLVRCQGCSSDTFVPSCDFKTANLFHAVVGGFSSDDYVVNVGFAETGGGDADELAFFGQVFQCAGANVAHAAFQAADELIA